MTDNEFEFSATRKTLPIALLRLREMLMERFRPMLHEHGVTEQQWRILRVLNESGELDAGQLAEAACILSPSLSRILKALEARAYISLKKDPADGRRSLVSLTANSRNLIREIAPESAAIYAEIEARVGRDRIEILLGEIDLAISALEHDHEEAARKA